MYVDDLVNMNITDPVEPLQYGWELKEETMMPVDSGILSYDEPYFYCLQRAIIPIFYGKCNNKSRECNNKF